MFERSILLLAVACMPLASEARASTRLNPGTLQWADAARHGRADLLIFGDSIVNYGADGWAGGIAQAAKASVGLAGSALLAAAPDPPSVWAGYTGARIWAGPADDSAALGIPAMSFSRRNYRVGANFSFIGTGIDPIALDLRGALDLHVFASGLGSNASLTATRSWHRNIDSTSAVIQASGPRSIANGSFADYPFHFDAPSTPGDWNSFEFTPDSRDTAIYYAKLIQPESTGMTVSAWSFSGGTTQGFRNNYYNDPQFTAPARSAFYRSLVAGNSGKLNVALAFGVNDMLTCTPAEVGEQIQGLIADVRRDWQASGKPSGDLSFTLMSTYQPNAGGYPSASFYALSDYRQVLDSIAAADARVSFLDIWQAGPSWQTAMANHYLADNVHPTSLGTRVYGEVAMSQLMPTLGDTDIDGDIDFEDLLALARNYENSSGASWAGGDFNGDGMVSFQDLLNLVQNYGLNASLSAQSFEADWRLARLLAPEPQSTALLSTIGFASCRGRRRPAQ